MGILCFIKSLVDYQKSVKDEAAELQESKNAVLSDDPDLNTEEIQ